MTQKPFPDAELRWARALKVHHDDNLHLSEIATEFRNRFGFVTPLDQIFLGGTDKGIGVTIFFRSASDIVACEANGTNEDMRNFIYDELDKFGRGKRGEIRVDFEFDSFENVEKNFEGNYFLRMK